MKTLAIAILISVLLPLSLQAAEDGSERDILERDIRIYQLEIIARQERMQRVNQEIQVWQDLLKKGMERMKEMNTKELKELDKQKEEGKTKGKKENKP